jgi:hypothetical protein
LVCFVRPQEFRFYRMRRDEIVGVFVRFRAPLHPW